MDENVKYYNMDKSNGHNFHVELSENIKEVRLVCCSDKLSNIMNIEADRNKIGEKIFQRFNAPKEQLAWYYRSIAENLNLDGYNMFDEYKAAVERVFGN